MKHLGIIPSSHSARPTDASTVTRNGIKTSDLRHSVNNTMRQDEKLPQQDRFEKTGAATLTRRIISAIGLKKHGHELVDLVAEINKPGFFIQNIEKTEAALTKHIQRNPDEIDAYLWRGIVRRIWGHDGRQDLRYVLTARPNDRLAMLNLAAMPLCVSPVGLEENSYNDAYLLTKKLLTASPTDPFAEFISLSLNYFRIGDIIEFTNSLKELCTKHADYSPGIAAYAALLNERCKTRQAVDLAKKALEKDKFNALAFNLAMVDRWQDKDIRGLLPPYGSAQTILFFNWRMVFCSPYAQQDPNYHTSRLNDGV